MAKTHSCLVSLGGKLLVAAHMASRGATGRVVFYADDRPEAAVEVYRGPDGVRTRTAEISFRR